MGVFSNRSAHRTSSSSTWLQSMDTTRPRTMPSRSPNSPGVTKSPRSTLVSPCSGAGPRRPALQEMVDRLAIRNAHLLGNQIVTTEVLAAGDVCWVPTRIDRGRQAALEAMAMGRAVVASDVPCLRELIRDGETGYLVPPGDPVAIARRTRALLRDPELCTRVGFAAQKEVRARFGLPRVATRWHGLYNDVAA